MQDTDEISKMTDVMNRHDWICFIKSIRKKYFYWIFLLYEWLTNIIREDISNSEKTLKFSKQILFKNKFINNLKTNYYLWIPKLFEEDCFLVITIYRYLIPSFAVGSESCWSLSCSGSPGWSCWSRWCIGAGPHPCTGSPPALSRFVNQV